MIASSLEVYEDTYQLVATLMDVDKQMERTFKPTLGRRMVDTGLDLFAHIESSNRTTDAKRRTYHQEQFLMKLELLKTLIRLCNDRHLISEGMFAHLSRMTTSISKQMTAWKTDTLCRGAHSHGSRSVQSLGEKAIPQVACTTR